MLRGRLHHHFQMIVAIAIAIAIIFEQSVTRKSTPRKIQPIQQPNSSKHFIFVNVFREAILFVILVIDSLSADPSSQRLVVLVLGGNIA